MPARQLRLTNLLLDGENPRISKATAQKHALQEIIDDQELKLVALAQDIRETGLNPMDRFLVIKAPDATGKYIVIEGNRRLAAIKILHNPTILSGLELDAQLRGKFEAVAAGFDLGTVDPIDCFEVADRAEGAPWIRLRHTGENGGRGIVDWSSVASRRFIGRDPALQALDFVVTHGGLTDDEKKRIEERFPITTLDRLLSTPAVRSLIGLELKDQKLTTKLPADEVMKPLRRMVRDLATKSIVVTELKKKDQQIAYVSGLRADLPNLKKKSKKVKSVDAFGGSDFKLPPAPRPRVKLRPTRKSLIPKDCRLNVTNSKIDEIVIELRSLTLVDYHHAISVLFRVFLETSVDDYLTRFGVALTYPTPNGPKDKSLKSKVRESTNHMITGGTPKKNLAGLLSAIDDVNNPLNPETLNNYVHNRFFSPTDRHLKTAWDNAQPFFEKIWP